ncbi:NAD(P)H-quinone oxidoreductase [Corynebacterium otitidis]|uniref:Putative quinone oxidoreductase n=1 Tax=Corynebacterium otitidis ATCC 51513 TaxID=883169 RepID=I7L9T5_9CORY|nr:NAD(P)H-quinone oxidoreductase [Corynebacterium otitidis]EJZ81411.1 hypothetical protein HMPREF9719_01682 [Corynebacterium otitidis ATCC 51513]CCI84047.1 putative quinone oxidoreductase [Corynebacterium otitidis ATCC 51513]
MKAVTLKDQDDPSSLVVGEVDAPTLRPGEALIKVRASGVNRADLAQARGNYPPPPGASEILGLEASGTVADPGDTGLKPGAEVACLLAGGGYGEYVAAPKGQIAPVPEPLSLVEAGSVMEVACTVWSNLGMVAGIKSGQRVLIHGGAGGIGSMAIQVAKATGCEVATTAGSKRKLDHCASLGADILINYREEDFAEVLGRSVDVILDVVGGEYLERNLKVLNNDGQLVVMGLQGGRKAEINLGAMMPRRQSLHARTIRARGLKDKARIVASTVEHVWPWLAEGKIRHHVDRVFPLENAADAHAALLDGSLVGKAVLDHEAAGAGDRG